jgi:hypothetical protein
VFRNEHAEKDMPLALDEQNRCMREARVLQYPPTVRNLTEPILEELEHSIRGQLSVRPVGA